MSIVRGEMWCVGVCVWTCDCVAAGVLGGNDNAVEQDAMHKKEQEKLQQLRWEEGQQKVEAV